MKSIAWRDYLEDQRDRHQKLLFTVTELANAAGTSRAALNVELSRLRKQGVIVQYAHGLYGLPGKGPRGAVPPEILVPAIDSHAYITGHYALLVHGLVTQVPTVITCFTDRRSPRARQRRTPVGRLLFICVRSKVYCPMPHRAIAPAAQALCDYVYLCRRGGVAPEALVTLRNLSRAQTPDLADILARYPITVERHVERLLAV